MAPELGVCGILGPACLTTALNSLWSPCLLPLASLLPTTQHRCSARKKKKKKDEVLFISFKETFLASKRERSKELVEVHLEFRVHYPCA